MTGRWQSGALAPAGLVALVPLCAPVQSLLGAILMAASFAITLSGTTLFLALLGPLVSTELRVVTLFLIAGTWAAVTDLCAQAALFPLWHTLDPYVGLVAANALVLARGETSLRGQGWTGRVREGVRPAGPVAAWLLLFGLAREILGRGQVFSDAGLVAGIPGPFDTGAGTLPVLLGPVGPWLLLGAGAAMAAVLDRTMRGGRP